MGLSSLPSDLEVRGNLDLTNCVGLTSLPDDLRVGGNLILSNCTGLTSLPPSILRWAPLPYGRRHVVEVSGSGISERVIDRILSEANAIGVQFSYSMEAPARPYQTNGGFGGLGEAIGFWCTLAEAAHPTTDQPSSSTSVENLQQQAVASESTTRWRPDLAPGP